LQCDDGVRTVEIRDEQSSRLNVDDSRNMKNDRGLSVLIIRILLLSP
jgi:hypothetical protein